MRSSNFWGARWVAAALLLPLAFPYSAVAAAAARQDTAQDQDGRTASALPSLPDPNPAQNGQTQQGTAQTGDQNPANKPVGTAAAPLEKSTGIAGSRPAGAVIAPAKQKRQRALFIRVAIIAGAAIAVGAVVGLSEESRSRP
jgi:hypothetical protein